MSTKILLIFIFFYQETNIKYIEKSYSSQVNALLLDWYAQNKRALPFRETKDPYKILVSEVMAQQTQIKTLLPYYERFIKAFPSPEVLAKSDLDQVYHYWEGLGYYSRARNLKRAAEMISKNGFPDSYQSLLELPGVGPYTAGAIASIAYGERVPAVDGNVIRVLSRIYGIEDDLRETKNKRILSCELTETMPEESGEYNQSLMELGALICESKNPNCLICPLRLYCRAYNEGLTTSLPVKPKRIEKKRVKRLAIIPLYDNEIYYIKREENGLLSNTFGFPITDLKSDKTTALSNLKEKYDIIDTEYLGSIKHVFTHLIWEVDVYSGRLEKPLSGFTSSPSNVATAFKKMKNLFKKN